MEWQEYFEFRQKVCNRCIRNCRSFNNINECITDGINMIPKREKHTIFTI